jgi:hypothetical protein
MLGLILFGVVQPNHPLAHDFPLFSFFLFQIRTHATLSSARCAAVPRRRAPLGVPLVLPSLRVRRSTTRTSRHRPQTPRAAPSAARASLRVRHNVAHKFPLHSCIFEEVSPAAVAVGAAIFHGKFEESKTKTSRINKSRGKILPFPSYILSMVSTNTIDTAAGSSHAMSTIGNSASSPLYRAGTAACTRRR